MLADVLNRVYFGNRLADYLLALVILTAGLSAVRVLRWFAMGRLRTWARRTSSTFDDALVGLIGRTVVPLLSVGVFYLAFRSLRLNTAVARGVDAAGLVVLTVFAVVFVQALLRHALDAYAARQDRDIAKEKALRGLVAALGVAVWGLGLVFLLDNLGFRVSTVIAGLGIGGIAVALAAQSFLGDLFSYAGILLDKPFEVGDFIAVGDCMGVVDYIGVRTTRLNGIGGEQIILPNRDLTGSRVRNYRRMERRRVAFRLTVVYDTDAARLREMPALLERVVRGVPGAAFERAHFAAYADMGLVFEVVYFVPGSDYAAYMDVQQQVNLRIYDAFEERGILFARTGAPVQPPGKRP